GHDGSVVRPTSPRRMPRLSGGRGQEEPTMAVYRIYLVHDDGRLEPDESFYCTTDQEAVARLKPPAREDIRVELWQGGRFLAASGNLRPRPDEARRATG